MPDLKKLFGEPDANPKLKSMFGEPDKEIKPVEKKKDIDLKSIFFNKDTGTFKDPLQIFGELGRKTTEKVREKVGETYEEKVPEFPEALNKAAKLAFALTPGADFFAKQEPREIGKHIAVEALDPINLAFIGGGLIKSIKGLQKGARILGQPVVIKDAAQAVKLGKSMKGFKEGIKELESIQKGLIKQIDEAKVLGDFDKVADLSYQQGYYKEAIDVAKGGGITNIKVGEELTGNAVAKVPPLKTPVIKQPMGEMPSTTLGYNIGTMHPKLKETLPKIIEDFRNEFDVMRGQRLTTRQAVDTAIKHAATLTDDKIMRLSRGTVKNSTDVLGARIYVNNRFIQQTEKMNNIPKNASDKLVGDIDRETKRVLKMFLKVRAMGTETARSLYYMRVPIDDAQINAMVKFKDAIMKRDPKSGKILEKILNDSKDNPRLRDKIVFWWYNSMLSNPFTDLANITGNTSHQLWETATIALTDPLSTKQILKGIQRGVPKGIKEAGKIYRQETTLLNKIGGRDIRHYDVHPKTKLGRFFRSILPTTRLSMEDAFASTLTKEIRLGVGARKLAKAEGVKPKDVINAIDNYLKDPQFKTPETYKDLAEYLDKYAEYMTFRTRLKSKLGQGAQETLWAKPIIPFVRVMANIMKAGYKSSPAGFIKLFGKEAKNLTLFERQDIVRRAVAGSIFYTGIGTLMHNGKVEVTGNGPEGRRNSELWDKMGYKPNHIYYVNEDGTKKGVSYQNINPFNVILAVMGNWQDQYRFGSKLTADDKSFDQKLSYALGGAAATMTDQSFMQGVNQFFNWVEYKDERYLQDFFTKPFIPNIVGFPRNLKEYIQGEKPRYDARTWFERIKRRVGLYEGLPPVYSAYGGQKQSGYERFPFFPSKIKRDPMLEMFQKRSLEVSVPSKTTKLGNRIMTPLEYSKYVKIGGNNIIRILRENEKHIRRLNDEEAQKFIDRVIRKERTKAKEFIN